MWQNFVIGLAQLTTKLARLFGFNGTSLPGLIVERLSPNLLVSLSHKLPQGVIVVTGTNGKTTTAKMIRHLLENQGWRVLANRSGSNFTRGILASFIQHASLNGNLDYDIAVLEIDEAYTPHLSAQLKPHQMVVLNIMRDQLDRYGEIDHTAELISRAAANCQALVLNAGDPPVASLGSAVDSEVDVDYFGATAELKKQLPSDDELMGESQIKASKIGLDVALTGVKSQDGRTKLNISVGQQIFKIDYELEGVHNALNATAAIASINQLFGFKTSDAQAMAGVKPAFGRGERLIIDNVPLHLALIKNPSGFNQNIRSFVRPSVGLYLIVINDRYADGRDVSWLWDVDLSSLPTDGKFILSGIRSYDMALRLQYEGIKDINIEPNLNRALSLAIEQTPNQSELLVLPTYTAMLELRKLLSKKTGADKIWK